MDTRLSLKLWSPCNEIDRLVHQHFDESHVGHEFCVFVVHILNINVVRIGAHLLIDRVEIRERGNAETEQ